MVPRPRVLDGFPYPVAYPYSLLFRDGSPASVRRWALCFTLYQLLRLSGLSLVSGYLRNKIDPSDADAVRALNTAITSVRAPFFSDWITLLHTARKHLRNVGITPPFDLGPPLDEMKRRVEDRPVGLHGRTSLNPFEAILALRNSTAHGGLPDENEAARQLDVYVPVLHQITDAFDFLGDASLYVGAATDRAPEDDAPTGRRLRGHKPESGPIPLPASVAEWIGESGAVIEFGAGRVVPLYPFANAELGTEPFYLYDGHYGIRTGSTQAVERSYVCYLGDHHRVDDSAAAPRLRELLGERRISFYLDRDRTAPWTIADCAATYSRRTLADLTGTKYFPECYVPFPELEAHFQTFLRVPPPDRWPASLERSRYANGLVLVGLAGAGKTALLARQVEELLRAPAGEDRADRESPNVVLFVRGNGIALRPEGVSLFRDIAEKLGVAVTGRGFEGFRDLFDHLHKLWRNDRVEGRRLVLVLDALNEAPFAELVIREALELIRTATRYPWCKVVVSTRQEWLSIWEGKLGGQEVSPLEELRPFLYAPDAGAEWGRQAPPVLAVEPFSAEQAGRVYEHYRGAQSGGWGGYHIPSCRTPWEELPAETRELLTSPLYLHLFMEAFDGRRAEAVHTTPVLFRHYVTRSLQGRPGLEKAIEPVVAHLLREPDRPSVDLDDDDCNQIRRAWAGGLTAEEARLRLSPIEALAHEGFLAKRVREEGGGYRFIFQAVAEYLIYQYLASRRPARNVDSYWIQRAAPTRVFAEYIGAFGFLLRDWPVAQRDRLGAFLERAAPWATDVAATWLVELARTGYMPGRGSALATDAAADLVASGAERVARVLHTAGAQLRDSRFPLAALAFLERSVAVWSKLPATAASPDAGGARALALTDLGRVLGRIGRVADAESALALAIETYEGFRSRFGSDPHLVRGLAAALDTSGQLLRAEGRLAEAEQRYRQCVGVYTELWGSGTNDPEVGGELGRSLTAYGEFLLDRSRTVEAEATYRQAIALYERLAGRDRSATILRGQAEALNGLGELLLFADRSDEASALLTRAAELLERLFAAAPDDIELGSALGRALVAVGDLGEKVRGTGKGRASYLRAVEVLEALDPARLENLDVKARYAGALCRADRLVDARTVVDQVLQRIPLHPVAIRWHLFLTESGRKTGSQKCHLCGRPATVHISHARRRLCVAEWHLCNDDATKALARPKAEVDKEYPWNPVTYSARRELTGGGEFVQLDVEKILISEIDEHQIAFLRELNGERKFLWVIGLFEATMMDRQIRGLRNQTPRSHDAVVAIIVALGGQVQDVTIHDLQEHTYYCDIRVVRAGREVKLDVRPSDGVLLALTCGVPIFVARELLDVENE